MSIRILAIITGFLITIIAALQLYTYFKHNKYTIGPSQLFLFLMYSITLTLLLTQSEITYPKLNQQGYSKTIKGLNAIKIKTSTLYDINDSLVKLTQKRINRLKEIERNVRTMTVIQDTKRDQLKDIIGFINNSKKASHGTT